MSVDLTIYSFKRKNCRICYQTLQSCQARISSTSIKNVSFTKFNFVVGRKKNIFFRKQKSGICTNLTYFLCNQHFKEHKTAELGVKQKGEITNLKKRSFENLDTGNTEIELSDKRKTFKLKMIKKSPEKFFKKLNSEDLNSRLSRALKTLKSNFGVYSQEVDEAEDRESLKITFKIFNQKKIEQLRLKLFLDSEGQEISFVAVDSCTSNTKKMISKTSQLMDKEFDEAILELVIFWKATVLK